MSRRFTRAALLTLAFVACGEGAMSPDAGRPGVPTAAGVVDGPASEASRPPPGASCSCMSGCGVDEQCLHDQPGSFSPMGLQCSTGTGLKECRPVCRADRPCPASRPHCLYIRISGGCCSDTLVHHNVCCANPDASNVANCF